MCNQCQWTLHIWTLDSGACNGRDCEISMLRYNLVTVQPFKDSETENNNDQDDAQVKFS